MDGQANTYYCTNLLVDPMLPIWPSQSLEVNIKIHTTKPWAMLYPTLFDGWPVCFLNAHTYYHYSSQQRENPAECIKKGVWGG